MHSIPLDEEPLPPAFPGGSGEDSLPLPQPAEVEVLGDLRGHVLAGRFVLVELLGSGELGCVYSGRDQVSGQPVTVKVLASPEQREVVARIADRARRRLGVRHPCVAAVLAEGTMGGLWYGVMEHAPGKNIYHAEDDPRFVGAGLLALAAQLAEGLANLHALGAPHGAISPHNLVWSDAGVKLVDLDVHLTGETANEEPSAWADVTALARVILELAAVREDEAPWVAAVARVARGELRPTAAEWVEQLRAAEVEALRPQVVAAATHGEGAIDSAWDALFEETDGPSASASAAAVVDDGLRAIEPPPQLAMVSFEVESSPSPSPPPPPAAAPLATPDATPSATSVATDAAPVEPKPVEAPRAAVVRPAIVMSAASLAPPTPAATPAAAPAPAPRPATIPPAAPTVARPAIVLPAEALVAGKRDSVGGAEASAALPLAAPASFEPSPLTASATVPAVLTASTTTPGRAAESWTGAEATTGRNNMRVAFGLLAFAIVCAVLGWRLQAWATAESQAEPARPEVPAPASPEAPAPGATAALGPRTDLSSGTATLARAAEPPAVAAPPADEPPADALEDAELAEDTADTGADQLSAADFRRILLRTNRSQRVRSCYERHGGEGRGDVEMVALIGRGGRVQKLRMGDDPLAECLRKIVLRLEFPAAERQAQHNYVFHRPVDGD